MRAQQGFEFLTIIAIVLFASILLFIFIGRQAGVIGQTSVQLQMEQTALNIDTELRTLSTAPFDVIRNITLGQNASLDNGVVIVNESNQEFLYFLSIPLYGNLCRGENTLLKFDTLIAACCNCADPFIELPQQTMCSNESFFWGDCSAYTNTTQLIHHCPSDAVQAEFEVDNGTVVLINTSKQYDSWFVLDYQVTDNIAVLVTCYDALDSVSEFVCDDGVDNDGDGLTDMGDPGCTQPTDEDEFDTTTPSSPPAPPAFPGSTECSDSIDNDGDTLIDMADSDCTNPLDDSE